MNYENLHLLPDLFSQSITNLDAKLIFSKGMAIREGASRLLKVKIMKRIYLFLSIYLIIFGLIACSNEDGTYTQILPTFTPNQTPTQVNFPNTPTPLPTATRIPLQITPSDPASFPLSAIGDYEFGKRVFTFNDVNRDNHLIKITIWYPANRIENSATFDHATDAPPNLDGAPYPIILASAMTGSDFGPHLVSHGYIFVGVNGMEPSNWWGTWLIDYPLDLVFTLNQIADAGLEGLEGMIDSDHVGVMGYSFDGYDSLALSGARVDPEFYLSQCGQVPSMKSPPADWWVRYICELESNWDQFAAHAGDEITSSKDGLWQSISDERILAVMPMSPEGAWLFGDRGLAAVNRPALITVGTLDDMNYYDLESVFIFDNIKSSDKKMISFIGEDHMMIFDQDQKSKLKHFAVAFFGYYLQGREEYANYFSEEFVEKFEDLAWGVYPGD